MLNIKYEVHVKCSDENYRKIVKFFQERLFIINDKYEIITGKRGSLLNNLYSFNMQNIRQNIRIIPCNGFYLVEYLINTKFQIITEYNKNYWNNEIDDLLCSLTNCPRFDWNKYHIERRKNDKEWSKNLFGPKKYLRIILIIMSIILLCITLKKYIVE